MELVGFVDDFIGGGAAKGKYLDVTSFILLKVVNKRFIVTISGDKDDGI